MTPAVRANIALTFTWIDDEEDYHTRCVLMCAIEASRSDVGWPLTPNACRVYADIESAMANSSNSCAYTADVLNQLANKLHEENDNV